MNKQFIMINLVKQVLECNSVKDVILELTYDLMIELLNCKGVENCYE